MTQLDGKFSWRQLCTVWSPRLKRAPVPPTMWPSWASPSLTTATICWNFVRRLIFEGEAVSSQLLTVSGLARPTEDSPYLIWLHRVWPWLQQQITGHPGWFQLPADDLEIPEGVIEGWEEWWPTGVFALPLQRRSGETLGWVCFLLDQPPTEQQANWHQAGGSDLELLLGNAAGGQKNILARPLAER